MIYRIVCMEFFPEKIGEFEVLMKKHASKIRSFPGCRKLEILKDCSNPSRVFTYSHWDNESALEAYRNSELFRNVWGATRKLFAGKPMAWTVEVYENLSPE